MGVDVCEVDEEGWIFLYYVVIKGFFIVICILFRVGVDFNVRGCVVFVDLEFNLVDFMDNKGNMFVYVLVWEGWRDVMVCFL